MLLTQDIILVVKFNFSYSTRDYLLNVNLTLKLRRLFRPILSILKVSWLMNDNLSQKIQLAN